MTIDEAIKELEQSGHNTRFDRLMTICAEFFGAPRIKGSHHIYKMKWPGRPFVNLQSQQGKAKAYQVRDTLEALRRLKEIR